MSEKDVKKRVNEIRREIDSRKNKLTRLQDQLRIMSKESGEMRNQRDKLNDEVKNLAGEGRVLRQKRDSVNKMIKDLKTEKKKLIKKVKPLTKDIKETKSTRDELNKSARGTDEKLEEIFEKTLETLKTDTEVPLDKEIHLFNRLFDIQERLKQAKKASELHQKVVSTYSKVKELDGSLDMLSDEIKSLSNESEKYHKQALEVYSKLDDAKKQANEIHQKLMEEYSKMDPIRGQMDGLRNEIKKLREDLAPYTDELDQIRSQKEEEKKALNIKQAKEKLEKQKRVSLDDFRALFDSNSDVI